MKEVELDFKKLTTQEGSLDFLDELREWLRNHVTVAELETIETQTDEHVKTNDPKVHLFNTLEFLIGLGFGMTKMQSAFRFHSERAIFGAVFPQEMEKSLVILLMRLSKEILSRTETLHKK